MLSADFSRFGEETVSVTESGADILHLDVMDGSFVKNISFGPKFIKDARPYSKAVFDAHLMIVNPWNYIERFADAGADIITVHYEACKDRLKDTLKAIKSLGVKCGAVNKGKFCQNCGEKKPADAPLYRCDKCGWEPEDPKNPPKFCPQCGDRFDENDKV